MFDLPPFPDDWFTADQSEQSAYGVRASLRRLLAARRAQPQPDEPLPPAGE